MSCPFSRREMLRRGAIATGWAVGGWTVAGSAKTAISAKQMVAPSLPVAIQRSASYDPKVLMPRLKKAIDLIGGIDELVRGKTVTIKLGCFSHLSSAEKK